MGWNRGMSPPPRHPPRTPSGLFVSLVVAPILWAVPFALFFGTLYSRGLGGYGWAYVVSLVFAVVIRGAIALAERFVVPILRRRGGAEGRYPWVLDAAVYAGVSVSASFVAAILVDRFLVRGFLGSPRAWLVSGMFAVAFTVLVGGIIYARVFYRQAVARAVALERIRSELERAALRALRAQVNPHFLFNALNSIAALIASDPPRAEVMTERLAEVFRYALRSSEREHVSLREELEFVRSYLEIERARLGERLKVEEEVDPRALLCVVPPLVLQPLVENAVFHGAARRPEGGRVRLSAALRDEGLVLEVEDDGPGFEPGGAQGDGFGLQSVRERMRALGVGHGLELETAPGRGTRARVRLPMTTMHETEGRIDR